MFSSATFKLDDDDDFFGDISNSSSNLANIFGLSAPEPDSMNQENASLKYIPQKSKTSTLPIKQSSTSENDKTVAPAPEWNIAIAKVVQVYKLINQENISQGKVGMAVLKSSNGNKLKLILYRTKQNVLANITLISGTSKIFVQNDCIQCQDDEQNYWSIVFEQNDIDSVLKEIDSQYLVRNHQHTAESPENIEKESKIVNDDVPSKATILSRMAKMGKPLPQLISLTTEISDSSDQDDIKPVPIAYPRRTMNKIVPMKNVISSIDHSLVAYNPETSVANSGLNVLLADNRSQNTEIRMNLSKLETKIEKVLEKIDLIDIGRGSRSSSINHNNSISAKEQIDREADELELESKILELKKENRQLRLKITNLTEQYSNATTNLNVHSEINEEKIQSLQNQVKQLHAKELATNELINSVENLKIENERLNNALQEKSNEINLLNEIQENKYKELQKSFENCEIERLRLKNDAELLEQKYNKTQKQLEAADTEISELKSRQLQNECNNQSASTDEIVKMVMNGLYQKLSDTFSEKETFMQKEILKITATTIKTETLAALKK